MTFLLIRKNNSITALKCMCNAAQKMQKDVSRIIKDYLFGLVKQCP